MSKGLGSVQRSVLETLGQNDRPLYLGALAYVLFNEGRDDCDCTQPPRAFTESVRRAIHTLAARKLVRCEQATQRWGNEEIHGLYCWLPDKPNQFLDQRPRIRGADVEELILFALRRARAMKDDPVERWMIYGSQNTRPPHINPGDDGACYTWVISRVLSALGQQFHEGRAMVAIHRATKRLVAQGHIKAWWYRTGRYGWLKLHD